MRFLEINGKKNKIIFAAVLIVSTIITLLCAYGSSETVYSVQKFAVITEYNLNFDDDMVVETHFKLEDDNFKGIQVYLEFKDKEYCDSNIIYELYDEKTDALLGEYIMDLEYEYSAKYAFVDIPVEQSKGRKVYMIIRGQNISVPLQFKVSKNTISKQVLYKNNSKQDSYLVMQAVYSKEQSKAVDILLNDCIVVFFAFLVIIFGKINKTGKISEKSIEKKQNGDKSKLLALCTKIRKKMDILYNRVCSHRNLFLYLLITVCFISIFVFYYNIKVDDLIRKKDVVEELEAAKDYRVELCRGKAELEQQFECSRDDMSAVIINGSAQNIDEDSKINIQIIDDDNGKPVFDKTYKVNSVFTKKSKPFTVHLEQNIKESKNKQYTLKLRGINFKATTCFIDSTEPFVYPDYEMKIQNVGKANDIAVKVVYSDYGFIKKMYVVFAVLLFVFASIMFYVLNCKEPEIENVFAVFAFCLGFLYMLVITVYGVPDEASHIDTAYRYSNRLLGIAESQKPEYDYKRESDVDGLTDTGKRTAVNKYSYQRLYNGLFDRVEKENLVECYMRDNSNNAGIFFYYPAVIGMTVARCMKWGTIPMILLGRLFNLSMYIVLIYLSLRKLPFGKVTMALIATLPISMQQAASFSYDAMIIGYTFLFISYCLYMANKRDVIPVKDMLMLILLGVLVINCKGGVYAPVCLLILYIPYKHRQCHVKLWVYHFIVLCAVVLTFLKSYIRYFIARFGAAPGNAVSGSDGAESYTLGYLIKHPLKLVSLFANTFFERTESYLKDLLGGSLGWLNLSIPWIYLIPLLIILLLSTYKIRKDITGADRVVFFGISVLSMILVNFSMLMVWTSKEQNYISGVQGRYYLPFIFLLLIACASGNLRVKREKNLIFASVLVQCLILLRIVVISI